MNEQGRIAQTTDLCIQGDRAGTFGGIQAIRVTMSPSVTPPRSRSQRPWPLFTYSIDSAIAIVASRPSALSMRYVAVPSFQISASPTHRRVSSTNVPSDVV